MRVRREAFGQDEPFLEPTQRIESKEAVPMVYQHDEGRRVALVLKKVGTDPPANGVLQLGGRVLAQQS